MVFVVLGKKIKGKGLGRSQQVITNKGNKGKKIGISFVSFLLPQFGDCEIIVLLQNAHFSPFSPFLLSCCA